MQTPDHTQKRGEGDGEEGDSESTGGVLSPDTRKMDGAKTTSCLTKRKAQKRTHGEIPRL